MDGWINGYMEGLWKGNILRWGFNSLVNEGGWNELATTNAPVQDEAVQAVLGMNQKHILFPCPRIFQPPSLPQNFPLLPTSPPPPSYFFHLISYSLHL
jgi:hypothetical protein